jgi:calcium-dependent protein kinase
MVFQLSSQ